MTTRVERDRHYDCQSGHCAAPPPRRLAPGRSVGRCIPRRTWWLRTLDPSTGRRISIAYRHEADARDAARKVEAARVLGVDYEPQATAGAVTAPLFGAVATEALHLYQSTMSPRASTMVNHTGFLDSYLRPYFGARPVTPLHFSVLEMQRFIASLRGTLADSSIRASLPTLRIVLDHACKLGLLPANPMRTGERLWRPVASRQVEAFTASELRSLFRAARARVGSDFSVLVQVMAQAGLRPGEALAVRRADVDPAGLVSVNGSQSRTGRGPTKNAYSVRRVSCLHPVAEDRPVWRPVDAGPSTRALLDGLAVLIATAADAETRLFPWTQTRLGRYWARTIKAAGIPYRKPHALRHSFASILLSRGANLLAVQKAGGWRSAQVLLQTYARYMPEDASSVASSQVSTEKDAMSELTV